jgi:very-short-patch-repair endonuclease
LICPTALKYLFFNGKDAIGSELDFYFPQLRLAIELNGIFHYEPIYGADKLEQVQANDQQKSLRCAAAGIEFCTIDTSTVNHVTDIVKERYWTIVRNLVIPLLGRADDTNMQVS